MQLLRSKEGTTEVASSDWQILDDDASAAEGAAVAISYARYLGETAEWENRTAPWTVHIQPADDLLAVSDTLLALPEILIAFPVYTDGRGYSHAVTLRQHHAYAGDLVAVGDVRRDQLEFMQVAGFNAFQITGNDSVDDMRVSLSELQMPKHRLYSGAAL